MCVPQYLNVKYAPIAAVTWQGRKCRLTLNYENGFTLTSAVGGTGLAPAGFVGRGGTGSTPAGVQGRDQVVWHYGFDQLRASSDDSNRLLWLDFGGKEDVVRFNLWSVVQFSRVAREGRQQLH